MGGKQFNYQTQQARCCIKMNKKKLRISQPSLIFYGTILYSLIKNIYLCLFINNYSLILKQKIWTGWVESNLYFRNNESSAAIDSECKETSMRWLEINFIWNYSLQFNQNCSFLFIHKQLKPHFKTVNPK
jgi:hypothetical protein